MANEDLAIQQLNMDRAQQSLWRAPDRAKQTQTGQNAQNLSDSKKEQLAVQQINQARAQEFAYQKTRVNPYGLSGRRETFGVKGRIISAVARPAVKVIVSRMLEAVEEDKNTVWIFAIALAIFKDIIDIVGLGTTPFLGFCINAIVWLILYNFTSNLNATGPMLGLRIKIMWWIAGSSESILSFLPFLGGACPAWTIGILWTRHKVKQRTELAEQALERFNKEGVIDAEAEESFGFEETPGETAEASAQ